MLKTTLKQVRWSRQVLQRQTQIVTKYKHHYPWYYPAQIQHCHINLHENGTGYRLQGPYLRQTFVCTELVVSEHMCKDMANIFNLILFSFLNVMRLISGLYIARALLSCSTRDMFRHWESMFCSLSLPLPRRWQDTFRWNSLLSDATR